MAKKRVKLVTHTFKGARFDDHGLDIDVLDELIAYKKLLVETAKELYRRRHPKKERLRRNFEASLCIKFYEINPDGCTEVPLEREKEYDPQEMRLEVKDELDYAVELVAEAIIAANENIQLPNNFPKNVIPLFNNYGKTLRDDESFEQKPAKWDIAVSYSKQTRENLVKRSEGEYEDVIELTGEVRAADLDGCNFTLRLDDGNKISGKFTIEQESIITDALREHASQRLKIQGRAEFFSSNGKLKRIISVDKLTVCESDEPEYDPKARPIWEEIAEISASVPDDEWAKLPSDLSKNIDHYLYGAPKIKDK